MKIYHSWERSSSRPLSLAIGFFDGMHRGHAELARRARLLRRPGGRAGVVTFANHPASFLRPAEQPELISTLTERVDALAAAGYEECWLLPFDEQIAALEAAAFLELLATTLHATAIVTGRGFRFGHKRGGDVSTLQAFCATRSITYDPVDVVAGANGNRISSTHIRRLIADGNLIEADAVMTASYEIRGSVELGFGRGHDLGFPTVNLRTGRKLMPKDGVYAALARYDGRDYPALVSIGSNPQFAGATRTVEAWLRDFHATCYGHEIALRDFRFMRDQMVFSDVQSLMNQMHRDRAAVAYPGFG